MKKEFWIFVDGGAKKLENKKFHGSYGYIMTEATDEGKLVEIKRGGNYFKETTAPRMELMSVAHALTFLTSYIDNNDISGGEVYIVADSRNTVMTLTKWVFAWIKNMKDNILYRKDIKSKKMEPVLNQDVITTAYNLVVVLSRKFKIKFLHINSHIPEKEMNKAYVDFQEFNNMVIGKQDFDVLVKMNEEVDKLVNDYHQKGIEMYGE